MHATFLGFVVAGIMGAIVSAIDLSLARDKGLYRSVLALCLLYISFDVGTSLIIFGPLDSGAKLLRSDPVAAAGVFAGLIAPLLMRTKVTIPFLKGRPVVNAVAMLRKLQIKVGTEINERCAVAETDWIFDKVLPSLTILTLEETEQWAIQSLLVKFNDPKMRPKRDKWIADIRRAAADDSPIADCKHLIVQILQDAGSRHLVVGLMNRAKRKGRNIERSANRRTRPPLLRLHHNPGRDSIESAGESNGQEESEVGTETDPDTSESGPTLFRKWFGRLVSLTNSCVASPLPGANRSWSMYLRNAGIGGYSIAAAGRRGSHATSTAADGSRRGPGPGLSHPSCTSREMSRADVSETHRIQQCDLACDRRETAVAAAG